MGKIQTEEELKHLNMLLHHNMATVGGFFAAYAILLRADILGNAQTGSLIALVFAVFGNNLQEVLYRLLALALYMSGAMLYVFLKNSGKVDVRLLSLAFTGIAVVILAQIPADANPVLACLPIFFAMSFQWNCFPGEYGYTSSTIFSSNNTRQVSLSLAEYICKRDKTYLKKAGFFFGTLLAFHIGVVSGYFAVKYLSVQAVWCNLIFLLSALALLLRLREGKRAVEDDREA